MGRRIVFSIFDARFSITMKHEFLFAGAVLRRDSCAASRHKAAPTGTSIFDPSVLGFCHFEHREESMRAHVTSWSRPWILHFVQNDRRSSETGPSGLFPMVGRDRWARRSNPKSRIQNRK